MARFIVPNNSNAAVPFHQDISYNQHLSEFITVWLPLVDIDEECGGVVVANDPGKLEKSVVYQSDGIWLEGLKPNPSDLKNCVPMSPGDGLLFRKTVIHGSMKNTSNRIRFSLDLRYFPGHLSSKKHFMKIETGEICEPLNN